VEEIFNRCKEYLEYVKSEDLCDDGIPDYEYRIMEAAVDYFCPGLWGTLNERDL
jgi:uncharacterized protein (DUF608 family)